MGDERGIGEWEMKGERGARSGEWGARSEES